MRCLFAWPTLLAALAGMPLAQAATDCTQAAVPKEECDALIALYQSTDGPNWSDSPGNNWNIDNDICGWSGVQCGSGDGESVFVTHIDRQDKSLKGPIPSGLGNLTSLRQLILSDNRLTGAIPSNLGKLTQLEGLDLSGNYLDGSIPQALDQLTELQVVDLHSNNLSGSIPTTFNQWVNMAFLDLSYNRLTAIDPALITFLDTNNPGWADTQTLPPTAVEIKEPTENTLTLTWEAVSYVADAGVYRVRCGTQSGGPYLIEKLADGKLITEQVIDNLQPGTPYYCVVETITHAHPEHDQHAELVSVPSQFVSATTMGDANSQIPPTRILPNFSTLSVTKKGNGEVSFTPLGRDCQANRCTYETTTSVLLTAEAAPDSIFLGWGGTQDCSDGQVHLNGNVRCRAYFELKQFPLKVSKIGLGRGSISSTPRGINCGMRCEKDYDINTIVTLSATPQVGSVFKGWGGDPECSSGQVTISKATTCSALFELENLGLTINKVGEGIVRTNTVGVDGTGIDCDPDCTEEYSYGKSIQLTAIPNPGWSFKAWSDDCLDGKVTMTTDKTCQATFVQQIYPLKIVIPPGNAGGLVVSEDGGINCGKDIQKGEEKEHFDCSKEYKSGDEITLFIIPLPGSELKNIDGEECKEGCSKLVEASVKISKETEYVVSFYNRSSGMNNKLLTIKIEGHGKVQEMGEGKEVLEQGINCSDPPGSNDKCTGKMYAVDYSNAKNFKVTPATGWKFEEWKEEGKNPQGFCADENPKDNNVSFEYIRNKVEKVICIARFTPLQTLTIKKTGTGRINVATDPPNGKQEICNDATCTFYYPTNTKLVLGIGSGGDAPQSKDSPQSSGNFIFTGWPENGDCKEGKVTLSKPVTCQVEFRQFACSNNSPTLFSIKNGRWNDKNTWSTMTGVHRLPDPNDVLLTLRNIEVDDVPAKVKVLCNHGQLRSTATSTLIIEAKGGISNYSTGIIKGQDGIATSSLPGCDTGKDVYLKAAEDIKHHDKYTNQWWYTMGTAEAIYNEGQILGGNGGKGNSCGGNGGDVIILGRNVINKKEIRAGRGGIASNGQGGQGGVAQVFARLGGNKDGLSGGTLNSTGSIMAGDGGSGTTGGSGGNLWLVSLPNVFIGNTKLSYCKQCDSDNVRGVNLTIKQHRAGRKGSKGGKDGWVQVEPGVIAIGSEAGIWGGDVTIFGGDNWTLDLSDLAGSPIESSGDITLAVGKSSTVDLTGNTVPVLKAAGRVNILADKIRTDEGIAVEDLIEASDVVRMPSQTLYSVLLAGAKQRTGQPGQEASMQLLLFNNGPTTDTYALSIETSANWEMGQLPASVEVPGLDYVMLELPMMLPPALGAENIMTITAQSQADPDVTSTASTHIVVTPAIVEETPTISVISGQTVIPLSEILPPPAVATIPPCFTTGIIDYLCSNYGQVITDAVLTPSANVSGGKIAGTIDNAGIVSQVTVQAEALLKGGKLTGYIFNEGTIADFEFVGAEISGGVLEGNIVNTSRVGGTIKDVQLGVHAYLIGGKLQGHIIGDINAPALLEYLEVKADSQLSGVIIGERVNLGKDVLLGEGVQFAQGN